MYHFGYGSNLSIEFVKKELIPDAEFVMKAYLPNFEVRFPFWSEEVQAESTTSELGPHSLVSPSHLSSILKRLDFEVCQFPKFPPSANISSLNMLLHDKARV